MTSAKQEKASARAALIVPSLTERWHNPPPGRSISACFVSQPKLPQHGLYVDRTAFRREARDAQVSSADDDRADRDVVRCPIVRGER